MAGVLVALGRLVDREGIVGVGAGRDLSRLVVHPPNDNPSDRAAHRLSPVIIFRAKRP